MADAVDVKTYNDDSALGATAPSLELLEFVVGEKIDFQPGRIHVLFFWVSYYKGAWIVTEELSQLAEKFPEGQLIAISNDADRAADEKFLQKIVDGKIYDENTKAVYRLAVPYIAYDDKKTTGKLYSALSEATVVHVPQAFIVGKDGKIAWRQNLTQSFTMSQSNFADQLERVIKGEPLDLTNGPKPAKVVDEGEEAEGMADDMSLF